MKAKGLYFFLLLTGFGSINCGFQRSLDLSQCAIEPLSIYPCKEDDSTLFEFSTDLKNINDKGDKVLDFYVVLDEPMTEDMRVVAKIDQWKNGAWEEGVFTADGNLCEYIKKFCEKGWKKVRKLVNLPEDPYCDWPAGSFQGTNLEISPDDLSIPMSLFGRFRALLKIYNAEDDLIVGKIVEFQINPK